MRTLTVAEAVAEAENHVAQLSTLWLQLKAKEDATVWFLDRAGQGEAIARVLASTRANIDWLSGAGLDRLRQGTLASVPFPSLEAAWAAWKDAAIATGDVLTRALEAGDRWSASNVLFDTTITLGGVAWNAASELGSTVQSTASTTLPIVAAAVLVVAVLLLKGGR